MQPSHDNGNAKTEINTEAVQEMSTAEESSSPSQLTDGLPTAQLPGISNSTPLSRTSILSLQRTIGNKAVTRLIKSWQNSATVTGSATLQRVGGAVAPVNNSLAQINSLVRGIPPFLLQVIQPLIAAIQAGLLTVTEEQLRPLLTLLQNIINDPEFGGEPGEAREVHPGAMMPAHMVPLSQILQRVLGVNVNQFLQGNDLYIEQEWLNRHPIVLTGTGSGAPQPGSGQGQAVSGLPALGDGSVNQNQPPNLDEFFRNLLRNPRAPFEFDLANFASLNLGGLRPTGNLAPQRMLALPPPQRDEDPAVRLDSLPPEVADYLQMYEENIQLACAVLLAVGFNTGRAHAYLPFFIQNPPADEQGLTAIVRVLQSYPGNETIAMGVLVGTQFNLNQVNNLMPFFIGSTIRSQGEIIRVTQFFCQHPLNKHQEISWIFQYTGYDVNAALQIAPTLLPLNLSQQELQRAVNIYVLGGPANFNNWVQTGHKSQAANQAPHMGPLQGPPPMVLAANPANFTTYPLDFLLGIGQHVNFRTLIGSENLDRPYSVNPFLTNHARTLLATGCSVPNTITLLTYLCNNNNVAQENDFNQAILVADVLLRRFVSIAQIQVFFNNHLPFITAHPGLAPVIHVLTENYLVPNLAAIPWGSMVNIITGLLPLGIGNIPAWIVQHFPNTTGLTLRRLERRLNNFMQDPALVVAVPPPQNIAVADISDEFTPIETRLTQLNQMPPWAKSLIRSAFRLLPCTSAQMLTFLNNVTIRPLLNVPNQNRNAAYWIYLFALYNHHASGQAIPAFGPTITLNIAHAGGARNVDIDAWIIDHLWERHTFQGFAFQDPAVMGRPRTTFFMPPNTNQTLQAALTGILNAAEVRQTAWNGGEFFYEAYKLRIAPPGHVQNRTGNYNFTQCFYDADATGIRIERNVLQAISAAFPFL